MRNNPFSRRNIFYIIAGTNSALMKNLILLFITTVILVSCKSNEDLKMEIDQKIEQLNQRIKKRSGQRFLLRKHLKKTTLDYLSSKENFSEAEERTIRKECEKFEIRKRNLEIQDLRDHLEIQKLKQEYHRY